MHASTGINTRWCELKVIVSEHQDRADSTYLQSPYLKPQESWELYWNFAPDTGHLHQKSENKRTCNRSLKQAFKLSISMVSCKPHLQKLPIKIAAFQWLLWTSKTMWSPPSFKKQTPFSPFLNREYRNSCLWENLKNIFTKTIKYYLNYRKVEQNVVRREKLSSDILARSVNWVPLLLAYFSFSVAAHRHCTWLCRKYFKNYYKYFKKYYTMYLLLSLSSTRHRGRLHCQKLMNFTKSKVAG